MVVCDRYLASSIAYGEAQGLDAEWLTDIQRLLPQPSLTLLLDIAAGGVARRASRRRATSSSATCRCSAACARATCGRPRSRRPGCGSTASRTRTPSRRPSSAPFGHDSGCCKRPHFARARRLQHPRARLERRAGRRDVVDQHDHATSSAAHARRAAAIAATRRAERSTSANASRTLRCALIGRQRRSATA